MNESGTKAGRRYGVWCSPRNAEGRFYACSERGGGDYVSVAEQGWPLNHGAALAAPQAALSGSQTKASGFAGGYLLNATVTRFSA